ncbi:MAG: hypothetical protein ABI573_01445 [Chloroflexota bacterium]
MKFDRFRAPALAATAVLLISGAANVFAASPPATLPAPVAPVVQVAPADTDTLQEGDQTTPDIAGSAESTVEAPDGAAAGTAAEVPDAAGAAEAPEAAGIEADGPGGHADAEGQNVDHQFDGQE